MIGAGCYVTLVVGQQSYIVAETLLGLSIKIFQNILDLVLRPRIYVLVQINNSELEMR